VDVSKADLAEV